MSRLTLLVGRILLRVALLTKKNKWTCSPSSGRIAKLFLSVFVTRRGLMSKIFISYRRSDSQYVTDFLYKGLVDYFGKDVVFKDVDTIPLGENFKKYLDSIIAKCEIILVVIGERWLNVTNVKGQRRLDDPQDFVRIEVEAALKRGIPVIPLFVDGTSMPSPTELPDVLEELSYMNGMQIRPASDFERDKDKLIKTVEARLAPRLAKESFNSQNRGSSEDPSRISEDDKEDRSSNKDIATHKHGLTRHLYYCLLLIADHDGIKTADLSELLGDPIRSVQRRVKNLVVRGLVVRKGRLLYYQPENLGGSD